MSRVDEERDAARVAERLAQQKRADESKNKARTEADSVFSRLVQQQKSEELRQGQQKAQDKAEGQKSARGAIAKLLEESAKDKAAASRDAAAKGTEGHDAAHAGEARHEGQARAGAADESALAEHAHVASEQGAAAGLSGRAADDAAGAHGAQGRRSDAKGGDERLEERKGASDEAAAARQGAAKGSKGALKTDADQGGKGQQQQGKDGKGAEAAVAAFRLNPALMAPPPVASKKDTAGSERLRKIAAELAQKIVERVRVGTNLLGNVEFQIDLRQDVMAGLQLKVSAKNGKISAVFTGSDRGVLKKLEEQKDALQAALSARGLTLEQFKVEAKA